MALAATTEDDLSPEERNQDLWSLFKHVVKDHHRTIVDKSSPRYQQMLWAAVAPTGNIYRRNAFYLVHRMHTLDLWKQMHEIAEKYRPILGGQSKSIEDCAEVLFQELRKTTIVVPDSEESPTDMKGYLPIEEFLNDKVISCGPFVMYRDATKRSEEVKHRLVSLNVFLLQVIAPFLIFLNRWNYPTNNFKKIFNARYVKTKLTIAELLCMGVTLQDICTTILGILLLCAFIFIMYCYIDQQARNVYKMRRLPHNSFWLFVDCFANVWCLLLMLLVMPLLFWSEESATNIVLDSMTLIFLFKLDDLSEVLCSYVGMEDSDFQRMVVWLTALLSRCPVDLENVINAKAENSGELWSIKVDLYGNVLGKDGSFCQTRLNYALKGDAAARLNAPEVSEHIASQSVARYGSVPNAFLRDSNPNLKDTELKYYESRTSCQTLPGPLVNTIARVWDILGYIVFVGNFLMPLIYYLFCKPCYSDP